MTDIHSTDSNHTWSDVDTGDLSRADRNVWASITAADPASLRAWLARLGFAEGVLVPGPGDTIRHSEMLWPEGGRVMVSSRDRDHDIVATGTASLYVVTADPDPIHDRAVDLGAPLVRPMKEEDYGSRGFTITDPEGNYWSFGTYAGDDPQE